MFNVGSQELIIVLFVVLMLFGSKRIPEVARSFGKGVKDFRKAMAGLESEFKLDLEAEEKPAPPAPKLGAPEGTAAVGGELSTNPIPSEGPKAALGEVSGTAPEDASSTDSGGPPQTGSGAAPKTQSGDAPEVKPDGIAPDETARTWTATEAGRLPTRPKVPGSSPVAPKGKKPDRDGGDAESS